MMRIGWSSGKKKVGIGRLIDCFGLFWLVKIPSLRGVSETKQSRSKFRQKFRHCEGAKQGEQSR